MRTIHLWPLSLLCLLISCQKAEPTVAPIPAPTPPAVTAPVTTVASPVPEVASPAAAPVETPKIEAAPVPAPTPPTAVAPTPAATPETVANAGTFDWAQIHKEIDYGLATHLRNYDVTEAQWSKAVQTYQTKAIDVIATRKYSTPELLRALQEVPRPFLAYNYQTNQTKINIPEAYQTIIDLGYGATMSAPSIQAFMTAQMHPTRDMVALEIGTGSGSQAILLSRMVKKVYTIEVRQAMGTRVAKMLKHMKYANIETRIGDGYYGWKEKAPFDIIIVTCQANHIPPALVEQLKPKGVMIIPVGPAWSQNQQMLKVWKDPVTGKIVSQRVLAKTSFIPMLGANQEHR